MFNDAKEHLETAAYNQRAKKHKKNNSDMFYEHLKESTVHVMFFDTLAGYD